MKVAVVGIGYVGCVGAAILAQEGHDVVGLDVNAAKVDAIMRGEAPVVEPGLGEAIRAAVAAGKLSATTDARAALADAEVILVCVATPSARNGSQDTRAIERVAEEVGAALRVRRDRPVVVLRSTILPRTIEEVFRPTIERTSGKQAGVGFGLVVNPEFMREGNAIEDFYRPEFTLIGADDATSAGVVERLYAFIEKPIVHTDPATAVLVKYACNAFHATKVAFANEMARVCEASGADAAEVMRALCMDRRLNLSAAYLRPGMPFGGSCLPKDLRALTHFARQQDVQLPVLEGALASNDVHARASVERILAYGRPRVGILGIAFKAGTDDLRESPAVALVEALLAKGLRVRIYDGRVNLAQLVGANRDYVAEHLPHIAALLSESMQDVVRDSDVIVIGNGDAEFEGVRAAAAGGPIVVDLTSASRPAGGDGTARVRAS